MALLHMIPIASVDIAAAPQTFPRMRAWLAEAASVRFDAVTQRDKCAALEVRIYERKSPLKFALFNPMISSLLTVFNQTGNGFAQHAGHSTTARGISSRVAFASRLVPQ
jgi:hypothetical protein